jgi:hypothetical protein
MKRSIVSVVLSVVAILGFSVESQARGCRTSCCYTECCVSYCESVPCAAPAPAPVQYVEHKVTCYKPVTVEIIIDVVVCKPVTREEKFTYNVCVPVTKQVVQKVSYLVPVQKEVEFKYTVLVPSTVTKVVKQTTYKCVTEEMTGMKSICKPVYVTHTDCCGCCYTCCQYVTEMVPYKYLTYKHVPVVVDVTINEIICTPVVKVGKRMVCEYVTQVKDVTVNVCSYVTEPRVGVRHICEYVKETVKQKIHVCTMVPYETVVQVPVCTPCYTSYCAPSYGCCGWHGRH